MEEDSDLSFLTALILVMTLLPEIATAPGREHGYVSAAVEAPPEMVCSYPSSLGWDSVVIPILQMRKQM